MLGGSINPKCKYGDKYIVVFFFFQAEDGIRDYKVTGVQTCALPISFPAHRRSARPARRGHGGSAEVAASRGGSVDAQPVPCYRGGGRSHRSGHALGHSASVQTRGRVAQTLAARHELLHQRQSLRGGTARSGATRLRRACPRGYAHTTWTFEVRALRQAF